MLPIRDHNLSTVRPVVIWALIAITIAMFILTWPGSETGSTI